MPILRLIHIAIIFIAHGIFFRQWWLRLMLLPFFLTSLIFRLFIAKEIRLKKALEACGVVFIKLGQSLSLKPYIVGDVVAKRLSVLQDGVSRDPKINILDFLKLNLGDHYKKFDHINIAPISNASIAIVYKGVLKDSQKPVAIKIVKPNAKQEISTDIKLLNFLSIILEKLSPKYRRLEITRVVNSLQKVLLLELDLRKEVQNLELLRFNLSKDIVFRVPFVHKHLCTKDILVLDWVDGISLSKINLPENNYLDKTKIAKQILLLYCNQVYRDGIFHADMHPGNIFVDRFYNITLIDCGNLSVLSVNDRIAVAQIIHGLLIKNYDLVVDTYIKSGYVSPNVDHNTFLQAITDLGNKFVGSKDEAKKIKISLLLRALLGMSDQFEMKTQEQLLMLQKTMLYVEAVVYNIAPELNVWDIIDPWIRRWARQNIGLSGQVYQFFNHSKDRFFELFTTLGTKNY